MNVPSNHQKDFISILLQSNLHRKIELALVYDIPQRESLYILIDYRIDQYTFEQEQYINLTLTLLDETGNKFTYPIPWISNIEYNPEGTVMQDKIKVWLTVTNIAKKRNFDFHSEHKLVDRLTEEEAKIHNYARIFIYPDFTNFESLVKTNSEGMQINLADIVYINPMFKGRNFKKHFNRVAVLMPFQAEFNLLYSDILVPTVNQLGFEVKRGDDFFVSNAIIEDIWQLINESNIIIADLSGRNPNVYYEVGIAHTLGKQVVLIAQDEEDIPFDLRHLRYIKYNITTKEDKDKFINHLSRTFVEIQKHINIPRDIQDSLISSNEIFRIARDMRSRSVYAIEEDAIFLFVIEENADKVEHLKNQTTISIAHSYDESCNSYVFSVSGTRNFNYDEIVAVIQLDLFAFQKLKEVAEGKVGLYLYVINLEKEIISAKPLIYEELSRNILMRNIKNIETQFRE
ncbi:hypothetical protein Elgi_36250 [Paenibacillus elgii]|uniref:hypothetical protein n=1 Tax=Paenibacillus elgii TaxID=189691 RepID=UPI002D7B72F3|nr:hypothetical protein Elgi_36250 [Paenibacillus elgii]